MISSTLYKDFSDRLISFDCSYGSREERNLSASQFIRSFVLSDSGSILNIGGGGKRHLSQSLPNSYDVFEVDIQGDCDLLFNLDSGPLPSEIGSFDLCCAFDVLEHLENFHSVLEDLYSFSKRSILITLPVATGEVFSNSFYRPFFARDCSENGFYNKYYGLPLQPPADRHRWFLTFADIVRYFLDFEERHSCKVNFAVPFSSRNTLKKKFFYKILGPLRASEVFVPYVWIWIKKL
ncbi:hypothetical protein [Synechococcus sp. RS9916]|uniref:hypothetical protein n=1 Tax=Synechococcus sp. RS9916 TaxID=221359 RepID=UPI0012EA1F82|nr:hypothetical protein [Synechococcus sp. RS9916]